MPQHHSSGQHEHKHDHAPQGKRPIHHDWRFWVAVLLMLGAMGLYVATMDESRLPGGQVEQAVPADAE